MLTPNEQTLNFVEFYSTYIRPSSDLVNLMSQDEQSSALRFFAKAALLESVGWLELGSAVGYFKPSDAQEYMELLFARDDLDEVLVERRYLFDTDWLAVFSRSDRSVTIAPRDTTSEQQGILRRVFESCLVAWSQISRSVSATAAITQLSCAFYADVARYFDATLQVDDIAEALAFQGEFSSIRSGMRAEFVYAGYGESIEFLGSFRALSLHYSARYGSAIQGLLRKIAQLLRWRFFFFHGQTVLFSTFLDRYLDILQVAEPELRNGFRSYVQQIAKYWVSYQGGLAAAAS